ncbi:hypothetical protein [Aquimarina intermedia]|uniref:Lipocalin-like protein n=1 Tax=Aquimarina intermedia TaxID=350814 RepID=A0A5S5CG54_9FLAO|nr:hypothetical protein [Aquimarina intermedia]TYP77330.1 hypothetical protein BD809_101484 [Aquimarina intermedia]
MNILRSIFRLIFVSFICSLVIGCQDNEPETLEVQEENVFQTNSQLANLIQKISLSDGSKDNIIDNANCVSILLPITVTVNDTLLTVKNEDDFQLIENIYEDSDSNTDVLIIKFPITITLEDHMQQIVADQNELEVYVNQCNGENELDDDIECVNFKYPLELKVAVIGRSVPNTFNIVTDKELYDFLENAEEETIISLTFPITLINSNDEEITISNLDELENYIEEVMDDCDEDDDFDYNDDDSMVLADFLTNGNWIVDEYSEKEEDLTVNYSNYVFKFETDGTVSANNGQQVVPGSWLIDSSNPASQRFILNFEAISPFEALSQEWLIEESEVGLLALRVGSELTDDLRILVFEKP